MMDTATPEIREAVPTDLPALQAFLRSLSVTARASRFFAPVAELPPMLALALETGDPLHHFLVAQAPADGDLVPGRAGAADSIVALAQYARNPQARQVCDVAVVVADAWQGRGLGRRLMLHLLGDARRQGLSLAVGEVLRHNRAMLGLARCTGFSLHRHPEDATLMSISRSLRSEAVVAEALCPA